MVAVSFSLAVPIKFAAEQVNAVLGPAPPPSPARLRHSREPPLFGLCLPPAEARRSERLETHLPQCWRPEQAFLRHDQLRDSAGAVSAQTDSCQHASLPTSPLNFVAHHDARSHRDGSVRRSRQLRLRDASLDAGVHRALACESVEVNVTMVPSGTGLPAQSRMGSVCTRIPFLSRWARMRMLQGSDATSCTTRRTEAVPLEATNCAGPSFFDESNLVYATPPFDVSMRLTFGRSTLSSNFTGCGCSTRF